MARVSWPTPDGSVTDFTAVLSKDATVMRSMPHSRCPSDKSYKGVLEYSDEPSFRGLVGNTHSCIFDSKLTLMLGRPFS